MADIVLSEQERKQLDDFQLGNVKNNKFSDYNFSKLEISEAKNIFDEEAYK